MRAYPIRFDVLSGPRRLVRQLFLFWLIGMIVAAMVWHKDVAGDLASVLTLLVIGALCAVPLWLLYRLGRFAIG